MMTVGGVDTLAQRFQASRRDRGQAVAQHGGEDGDHLAVAIGRASKLATDPLHPPLYVAACSVARQATPSP